MFHKLFTLLHDTLDNHLIAKSVLSDIFGIDAEMSKLLREIEVVTEFNRKYITENSFKAKNHAAYTERPNNYVDR